MTRKLRAVIPAILCVALAASACSKKEETPTFTGDKTEEPSYQANLDFVTPAAYSNIQGLNLEPGTYISIIGKDENSSYWKEVKKGVEQAVKDLNKTLGYSGEDKIKATFNAPDGEDIDEQVNILDEELARYPDALGIASIDEDACKVQFDAAAENGIPVIALDSGNTYQGIQCTVKTNNTEAAKTVAIIGPGVMGKTSLRAFVSVRPGIDTVKIKGRGQKSIDSFVAFVKEECPGIKNIVICDSIEEAVKDSDIISMTTTVKDSEAEFPYIDTKWIKKGALISMPSAARFDEDFLVNGCKKVVDNYKLYEAWEEEYPYPTYDQVQIVGSKFTDLKQMGKITREDIIDVADVITGERKGRESEDEIIVYSVGGMPVEDIAWGATVYRRALKEGIGVELPLWDKPEMA